MTPASGQHLLTVVALILRYQALSSALAEKLNNRNTLGLRRTLPKQSPVHCYDSIDIAISAIWRDPQTPLNRRR